jgi:hypothetical protein
VYHARAKPCTRKDVTRSGALAPATRAGARKSLKSNQKAHFRNDRNECLMYPEGRKTFTKQFFRSYPEGRYLEGEPHGSAHSMCTRKNETGVPGGTWQHRARVLLAYPEGRLADSQETSAGYTTRRGPITLIPLSIINFSVLCVAALSRCDIASTTCTAQSSLG